MNSFYSNEELKKLGFMELGEDVQISRKASIYGASRIKIGNHVRIDDFCILSGKIILGNYIHIAAYTAMFAGDVGIMLKDFCGISSRSAVYAVTDDYGGEYLTNPTVDDKYRGVFAKEVVMEKHALIGTGCTVLPGVILGEGCSVGAMSLVNKSLDPWSVYVGTPARKMKNRSKKLLEMEKQFLDEKKKTKGR